MYDIGLEMQTSSWKYGKAVCDYAAGSFFNMCEYSVMNIADSKNRGECYTDFIENFFGDTAYEKHENQCEIFLKSDADFIAEPVFCISDMQWKGISALSFAKIPSRKYMLTYISEPDRDKRKAVLFYREKFGMECMNIIDGNYEENKKIMNMRNILPEMKFADFVKYCTNAAFVITDDYYALCLSIVLNKPFIYIGDDDKAADMLTEMGLNERVIFDKKNFPTNNRFLQPVDFSLANKVISEKSAKMFAWAKEKGNFKPVEKKVDKAVTNILDMNLCVGCSACVNVCPKGALSLKPDKYGYYCSSIEKDKCVNCGLCAKACPVLEPPENKNLAMPECWEFIAADENLVMQSSSGGVFSLLADEVLKRGGYIAGGAWRDDFSVGHIVIDKKEDMPKLRKSKYLQSYLGDTYKKVKEMLESGKFVLFSGCGCQVAGLRKFLKKDYYNLLTIDIFCHYSPSPMFFKKYLEGSFTDVQDYEFRHKSGDNCWNCRTVKVNETVRTGGAEDEYQRVFHSEIMMSEHCANCKFQSRRRYGDISLGDFWNIQKRDTSVPHGKGVSCVLVNNEKGRRFFESIPKNAVKWKKKVPLDWVGGNGFIYQGKIKLQQKNHDFYKAIRFMPFDEAANYALKANRGMKFTVKGSSPLQFDSKSLRFTFDKAIWSENIKDDGIYLTVKEEQSKPGNYAVLPLGDILDRNKTYLLSARFKFKSESKVLYFHVKDSGSRSMKIIAVHRADKNTGQNWIELTQTFTPPTNIFDEFVFGASQLKGNGAFIAIDYIYITEVE